MIFSPLGKITGGNGWGVWDKWPGRGGIWISYYANKTSEDIQCNC